MAVADESGDNNEFTGEPEETANHNAEISDKLDELVAEDDFIEDRSDTAHNKVRFIRALLQTGDEKKALEVTKLHRSTLWSYKKDQTFREVLRRIADPLHSYVFEGFLELSTSDDPEIAIRAYKELKAIAENIDGTSVPTTQVNLLVVAQELGATSLGKRLLELNGNHHTNGTYPPSIEDSAGSE